MKKSKKQKARLDIRRRDYDKMVAGSKNYSGYRRPGSNNK